VLKGSSNTFQHYVERPRRKTQTLDLENFCPEGLSHHYVEIPAVQSQQQSPSVENANKKKVHM
jgi:hypothetical protein